MPQERRNASWEGRHVQRAYTIAWLLWLAALAALETAALVDKRPGDTFSEHVIKWASMRGHGRMWRLRRLALLVVLSYLAIHLLSGGAWI